MSGHFTIFGGTGFIGAKLLAHLRATGAEVIAPPRGTERAVIEQARNHDQGLGHVIYAIGLTADFRTRPLEAVQAHVSLLADLIADAPFTSWLYLSSTRVYARLAEDARAEEDAVLPVTASADELYNLSKLLGEAICTALDNPQIRVARLSNVYGHGQNQATFLASLIGDIVAQRAVTIREAASSSKDYIAIEDVCGLLLRIATSGTQRVYNVASGIPTTHRTVADLLTETSGVGCHFAPDGAHRAFAPIDISRIAHEFGFVPRPFATQIAQLVARATAS